MDFGDSLHLHGPRCSLLIATGWFLAPSGFTQGFEATRTYQTITRMTATTATTSCKNSSVLARQEPQFSGFPTLFGGYQTFSNDESLQLNHQLIGWIYGFSKHWKRVEAKRWIKLALLHVPHIATGTPCNSQVLENLLCFKHLWVLRKQARAGSQLNESQVAATAMQHEQCSLYYGGGPKIGGTAKLSSVIGFSIITPL